MCSGFVFPLLPSPVSFGRVCCSSIHCLFFFLCLSMYVCASRRLGLCLRTWACEHKRVRVRVHAGWLGSRPRCLSPYWVTKAKPAHWPTFIEGLPAQPSRPWPQRWRRRWGGERRGGARQGWTWTLLTHTHIRSVKPKRTVVRPPPPRPAAGKFGEEGLISWECSPKMKID